VSRANYLEADSHNVNEVLEGRIESYRMKKQYTRLDGSSLDDLVDTLRSLTPTGSFGDDCYLVRLKFD
jgi:hypothetical protein